jgi:formylglycine-generating enzyme required for sulfatase activity
MIRYILLTFSVAFFSNNSIANNIQVSNLSLTDENRLEGHVTVQFDLTWENSWRLSSGPSNWDAAWVFMKYRVGNGEWKHAKLNNTGHTMGSGTPSTHTIGLLNDDAAFDATNNPCVGMFVYRSEASSGTFTNTGVKLRWNYGANGIGDGVSIDVKVFAIEMVYVAQGAFNVGGGGGSFAFTSTTINTADARFTPVGSGTLGGKAGGYPTNASIPDNSSWPNGYKAFYCMKYELSQQQYVDFLNTLTQPQANNRKYTESIFRYAISGLSVGNYSTALPYVACGHLSWADGAAYADWACLRPMTELEYEKSCRGSNLPIAYEYAWGTSSVTSSPYLLSNSGIYNEEINTNFSSSIGNASYNVTVGFGNIDGPLRVGIFASNASSTGRITSGASYWGIMELSGNVLERVVNLSYYQQSRSFTGTNGNGEITADGFSDVQAWPGADASGAGFRGGSWAYDAPPMRVSSRDNALTQNPNRNGDFGFRAVRD